MKMITAFLLVMAVMATADIAPTPFGARPEDCIVEVPHGATVFEHRSGKLGVKLNPQDSEDQAVLIDVPAHCHKPENQPWRNRKPKNAPQVPPSPNFPLNGWLDYFGWYPPHLENHLGTFTSDYTVPGNPKNAGGEQVLFYFIGMQNNEASAVNILQPVLTWGNGLTGWSFASWACCPSNITTHTPGLQGFQAGDKLFGSIKRHDSITWRIDSMVGQKNATLFAQVGSFYYDWADVTLEVYSVNSCDDFAQGPMTFSQMALHDRQGNDITSQAAWTSTGQTACGGKIHKVNGDAKTVAIVHTGA